LPLCPSEQSRIDRQRRRRHRRDTSSLGVGPPLRVRPPSGIAVMGSATPLRRWPLPRPCGLPRDGRCREALTNTHAAPLFGLDPPSESFPVELGRRNLRVGAADGSPGLSAPSAHAGRIGPPSRVFHARFVPPSGFGYPRDGLLPFRPRRPCFMPAALLGFTLRSSTRQSLDRGYPPPRACLPFLVLLRPRQAADRSNTPQLSGHSRSSRPHPPGKAVNPRRRLGDSPGFLPVRGMLPIALSEPGLLPRA
jgi:hypothetical protein